MTFAVPVVDITPYVTDGTTEARTRTAAEMDAACRTVGFVQIVGHGVPARITDALAAAMDGLFERPLDVKRRYRTPPEVNRGYSPPKSESLSLSLGVESATRMNDFFEAFNVGAAASWFPGLDLPQPDYAENTWPDVPGCPADEQRRAAARADRPRRRPRRADRDHPDVPRARRGADLPADHGGRAPDGEARGIAGGSAQRVGRAGRRPGPRSHMSVSRPSSTRSCRPISPSRS
jgi:non-haem dioxygenase in morphine synthesis N-terminal